MEKFIYFELPHNKKQAIILYTGMPLFVIDVYYKENEFGVEQVFRTPDSYRIGDTFTVLKLRDQLVEGGGIDKEYIELGVPERYRKLLADAATFLTKRGKQ